MPFQIPNEADAFSPNQAEPDRVDIDILVAGYGRTGVVNGCATTSNANMTVAVSAGTVIVGGAEAAVAGGNVTITAADATNPRFDLIVSNASGALSAVAGLATVDPVFPVLPASSVALAAVYVPPGDAIIDAAQIVDKRVMLTRLPSFPIAQFSHKGVLTVGAGVFKFRVPNAWVVTTVEATIGTNPVGSNIVLDVNKSGTTIFTTQANRPTLVPGGGAGGVSATPDAAASSLAATDYLTVDVDAVGSTTAGSDLTVGIWGRPRF